MEIFGEKKHQSTSHQTSQNILLVSTSLNSKNGKLKVVELYGIILNVVYWFRLKSREVTDFQKALGVI